MSKFFKKCFIFAAAIAAAVGLLAMSSCSSEKRADSTLTIGLQSGYPPFEFMDAQGKLVGFDLDVAERIAEKMHKTLVVKDMEFEGMILSLKQGKIDLIMSGMDITPSRLKEIFMIPYHGEGMTTLSLIFWKEIPEGVHSIEELAKLPHTTVSVETGTTSEAFIHRYYPALHAKSFQGALASLMDVKYGKSMADLVEPDVASYLQKKYPEIKILAVPLPKEEAVLGVGIGVKKENKELYQRVQQIIQELKSSGELKQLEEKWFKGVE